MVPVKINNHRLDGYNNFIQSEVQNIYAFICELYLGKYILGKYTLFCIQMKTPAIENNKNFYSILLKNTNI